MDAQNPCGFSLNQAKFTRTEHLLTHLLDASRHIHSPTLVRSNPFPFLYFPQQSCRRHKWPYRASFFIENGDTSLSRNHHSLDVSNNVKQIPPIGAATPRFTFYQSNHTHWSADLNPPMLPSLNHGNCGFGCLSISHNHPYEGETHYLLEYHLNTRPLRKNKQHVRITGEPSTQDNLTKNSIYAEFARLNFHQDCADM